MTPEAPSSPSPDRQPLPVLRVIGPPGSGKSLLIVALTESLRSRGHRMATAAYLRLTDATVITLSNDARVTLPSPQDAIPNLSRLNYVARAADPSITLLLAEDYDGPGVPALLLRPDGAPRTPNAPDILAEVSSQDLAAAFARRGPAAGADALLAGLVALVEREILGIEPPAPPSMLARLRGLLRR